MVCPASKPASFPLKPQVISWRRSFHTCPETGTHETETSRRIAAALDEMGIDHVMFLQNFGVLDSRLVRDSMHRIANEVMPQVQRRINQN